MSEQQDVIEDLSEKNVLGCVHWAYKSAVAKTLEDFSEDDGHDAALLGVMRYVLFRDRLDRVFHCGRYAVPSGDDAADLDLLFAGLSPEDRKSMPRVPAGLVTRSDLDGSPGWATGEYRFLLASAAFGKTKKILWSAKSKTKQRVARQRNPQTPEPTLFEGTDIDVTAVQTPDTELDRTTFVAVHTLDAVTGRTELGLGRTRLNSGGGPSWYWLQDLTGFEPTGGGMWVVDTPTPTPPIAVPDAPVRVRRRAGEVGEAGTRAS